jgi:hypothetical protein
MPDIRNQIFINMRNLKLIDLVACLTCCYNIVNSKTFFDKNVTIVLSTQNRLKEYLSGIL